ncbi:MAG: hypothetical protein QNJ46_06025 [Leptolyngbyaceae cyanobacterium MO_188.B28]|nr:hypothetical protein [Leptolyngbyaceae cyanobacterium MO_188.B28]
MTDDTFYLAQKINQRILGFSVFCEPMPGSTATYRYEWRWSYFGISSPSHVRFGSPDAALQNFTKLILALIFPQLEPEISGYFPGNQYSKESLEKAINDAIENEGDVTNG